MAQMQESDEKSSPTTPRKVVKFSASGTSAKYYEKTNLLDLLKKRHRGFSQSEIACLYRRSGVPVPTFPKIDQRSQDADNPAYKFERDLIKMRLKDRNHWRSQSSYSRTSYQRMLNDAASVIASLSNRGLVSLSLPQLPSRNYINASSLAKSGLQSQAKSATGEKSVLVGDFYLVPRNIFHREPEEQRFVIENQIGKMLNTSRFLIDSLQAVQVFEDGRDETGNGNEINQVSLSPESKFSLSQLLDANGCFVRFRITKEDENQKLLSQIVVGDSSGLLKVARVNLRVDLWLNFSQVKEDRLQIVAIDFLNKIIEDLASPVLNLPSERQVTIETVVLEIYWAILSTSLRQRSEFAYRLADAEKAAELMLKHTDESDRYKLRAQSILSAIVPAIDSSSAVAERAQRVLGNLANLQWIVGHLNDNDSEDGQRNAVEGLATLAYLMTTSSDNSVSLNACSDVLKCNFLDYVVDTLSRPLAPNDPQALKERIAMLNVLSGICQTLEGRERVQENPRLSELLVRTAEDQEIGDEVRRSAAGVLAILQMNGGQMAKQKKKEKKSRSETETESEQPDVFDVMLSYNWEQQPLVKRIRRALKKENLQVWFDLKCMKGDIVDSMAEAIEQSKVILLCCSVNYQNSFNCQAEAKYAYQQRKEVIPLKVGPYATTGWMAGLIGTKLYFDFTTVDPDTNSAGFNKLMDELVKEIRRRLAIVDKSQAKKPKSELEDASSNFADAVPQQARECVSFHIGQAGVGMAEMCWELFCAEHDVLINGIFSGHRDNDSWNKFFLETPGGKLVPRAAVVDLDPRSVQSLLKGRLRKLFSPRQLVCLSDASGRSNGSGNVFVIRQSLSANCVDCVTESVRRQAEECDNLANFVFYHSICGGTGSGLTDIMVQILADEYASKSRCHFTLYPNSEIASSVVEPYNAGLAIARLLEYDGRSFAVCFDNESLIDALEENHCVSFDYKKRPGFSNVNSLIARVVANVTAPTRFGGTPDWKLDDIADCLVRKDNPQLCHFIPGYAPILPEERSQTAAASDELRVGIMTRSCYRNRLLLASQQHANDPASSCVLYRGDVEVNKIDRAIRQIRTNPVANADANESSEAATGVQYCFSRNEPGTMVGDLANVRRSACCLSVSSSYGNCLETISSHAKQLMRRKAYLCWYKEAGLEDEDVQDAIHKVMDLEKAYKSV